MIDEAISREDRGESLTYQLDIYELDAQRPSRIPAWPQGRAS